MRYWLPGTVCVALLLVIYESQAIGTATGWSYEIYRDNLAQVSAIVVLDDKVIASLETRDHDGNIVALGTSATDDRIIASGLQKPDGLVLRSGKVVFTQEADNTPVYELEGSEVTPLFSANSAEGIAVTLNGDLYVVEDRASGGRVLKYDHEDGHIDVLLSGLIEGEGICIMPSGNLYIAEKSLGIIYQYNHQQLTLLADNLESPAYLNCDEDRQGIWITEDRTNLGRLLFLPAGETEPRVIASRLHSPQSIAILSDTDLLLAEQGRDRILRLTH